MTDARKPGSRLYSPPPGFYDLPFIWTYDASKLTAGLAYQNQYVYLQGGYGDFILRRVLGLSRILNPATGQYQIRDNDNNNIEQFPVFGVSADDIGLAPELRYQETGAVKFDLGIIALPSVPSTGQLCFQGVRRMKGSPQQNPTYKATPKTFTYLLTAPVAPPVGSFVTVRNPITDYDFELHQLIILASSPAAFDLTFIAKEATTSSSPFYLNAGNPVAISPSTSSLPYLQNPIITVGGNKFVLDSSTGNVNVSSDGGATWAQLAGIPAYTSGTIIHPTVAAGVFDGVNTLHIVYLQNDDTLAFIDLNLATQTFGASYGTVGGPTMSSSAILSYGGIRSITLRADGSLVVIYTTISGFSGEVGVAVYAAGTWGAPQILSGAVSDSTYGSTCVLETGSQTLHVFFYSQSAGITPYYVQFSSTNVVGAQVAFPGPIGGAFASNAWGQPAILGGVIYAPAQALVGGSQVPAVWEGTPTAAPVWTENTTVDPLAVGEFGQPAGPPIAIVDTSGTLNLLWIAAEAATEPYFGVIYQVLQSGSGWTARRVLFDALVTEVGLPSAQPFQSLFQLDATALAAATPLPSALTSPLSALVLYDSNKVAISNAPVVDIYMDGGPGGVYKNGAIVPPLWYPKDSQIQIDVYSELPSGSAELTILLVGKKYYPC
jgi:hypothetical protein